MCHPDDPCFGHPARAAPQILGADMDPADEINWIGRHSLHLAAEKGHTEIFRLVMESVYNKNPEDTSKNCYASEVGKFCRMT